MMKLGIIGLNEGNGHPYSYSAIFNGYDPDALQKECPFELIKQYLPEEHQNKNSIQNAKVTHIWTQDIDISRKISRVSLIPNIVNHYEDFIGLVDGVIIARDDPENHLIMAKPFLEKGIPVFIDKLLTHTMDDLNCMINIMQSNSAADSYPLMAGSAIRYNPFLNQLKIREQDYKNATSIQGISRVNWMRYGHHLFEGIAFLFGTDIEFVQYLGVDRQHEIYFIKYSSGLTVILEFDETVSLPIRFNIHSRGSDHIEVQFNDFFKSFKFMLEDFVKIVELGKPIIPHQEMLAIAKIILAGNLSKLNQGIKVNPKSLN